MGQGGRFALGRQRDTSRAVGWVSPYPFGRWPTVSRDDVVVLRHCAAVLPTDAGATIGAGLRGILGAEVAVAPLPLEGCTGDELGDALAEPLVALILASPTPQTGRLLAIEIDPRLAACVIDRALGGDAGPEIPTPIEGLSDVERGVLAYIASRCIAATPEHPLRLCAVVTTRPAIIHALGDDSLIVWPSRVAIGDDVGIVRAWLPRRLLQRFPAIGQPFRKRRAGLASLAQLEVTLVARIGHGTLTAGEVGSLALGDVMILDAATARPHRAPIAADGRPAQSSIEDEADLTGEVSLHLRGAGRTRWRCSVDRGHITFIEASSGLDPALLEFGSESQDAMKERATGMEQSTMADHHGANDPPDREGPPSGNGTDGIGKGDIIDLAGDAPILLSVEMARFSLPLETLASLRPGEILRTGRHVGDRVALRAGDRIIAMGELVDVDGEVGVRILQLGG